MCENCVANNMRRIMRERGLKHRAVAERAGFSEQQFSAMLNGRRLIKDCDVAVLAKTLNVTANDLFEGCYDNGSA